MCTGKCSKVVAIPLYILAPLSIICNAMLFFPDFKTEYAEQDMEGNSQITTEVKYMGGLIGGGVLALIPAIHIHLTGVKTCCANRCGMFLSIFFAALGVTGGLYSMIVAALGLFHGPTCLWKPDNEGLQWGTPFVNRTESYLTDSETWHTCIEPKDVVEFNLVLFSILLVAAALQIILCAIQMVNGLFGCLCGTCADHK
ncbi:unnamed protein product [Ophioblennius macclurei]